MVIALDSNILIRDVQFASQLTRALVEFSRRTQTQVLVHQVVIQEVEGYIKREIRDVLGGVDKTKRRLERLGVTASWPVVCDADIDSAADAWRKRLRMSFDSRLVEIDTDSTLLNPLVERAVDRRAPFHRGRSEFRDALLWLGLLSHCREKHRDALAFLSGNQKDFAEAGDLLPELRAEGLEYGVAVSYFLSIDQFVKTHAQPIEHITEGWVAARVDDDALTELLTDFVSGQDQPDLIPSPWRDQGWREYGVSRVTVLEYSLDDVSFYEFGAGQVEVALTYSVQFDVDIDVYRDMEMYEHSFQRERTQVSSQPSGWVIVSAAIADNAVSLIRIEDSDFPVGVLTSDCY